MASIDKRYRSYKRALETVELPAAFVDLNVFERNVAAVRSCLADGRVTLRVGSKSLRCVDLLWRITRGFDRLAGGVLAYTAAEAQHLVGKGFRDIVVAYPTSQRVDADRFARCNRDGASVAAMVDDVMHLGVLTRAARDAGTTIPVMIDVDMSWRAPGLREHVVLGVRRSPLYEPAEVVALARRVADTRGLRFLGVMGYEAQLAGLPDRDAQGKVIASNAVLKTMSRAQVRERRRAVCEALAHEGLSPEVVNGGGTGSLAWSVTDPSLTEVVVGSGFLGGTLFDGIEPGAPEAALMFALQVSRCPAPDIVTCLGGGYVASGPPSWERLPRPWMPEGLSLLEWEGAGEVQTPLKVGGGASLTVGDMVVFRHAKAGELAERFGTYHLVRGERLESSVPTYRGEGVCFL